MSKFTQVEAWLRANPAGDAKGAAAACGCTTGHAYRVACSLGLTPRRRGSIQAALRAFYQANPGAAIKDAMTACGCSYFFAHKLAKQVGLVPPRPTSNAARVREYLGRRQDQPGSVIARALGVDNGVVSRVTAAMGIHLPKAWDRDEEERPDEGMPVRASNCGRTKGDNIRVHTPRMQKTPHVFINTQEINRAADAFLASRGLLTITRTKSCQPSAKSLAPTGYHCPLFWKGGR